jgi:hypothetical protein
MSDATLKLEIGDLEDVPSTGGPVEVRGVLQPTDTMPTLRVHEITALPPGAAIQRPLVRNQP